MVERETMVDLVDSNSSSSSSGDEDKREDVLDYDIEEELAKVKPPLERVARENKLRKYPLPAMPPEPCSEAERYIYEKKLIETFKQWMNAPSTAALFLPKIQTVLFLYFAEAQRMGLASEDALIRVYSTFRAMADEGDDEKDDGLDLWMPLHERLGKPASSSSVADALSAAVAEAAFREQRPYTAEVSAQEDRMALQRIKTLLGLSQGISDESFYSDPEIRRRLLALPELDIQLLRVYDIHRERCREQVAQRERERREAKNARKRKRRDDAKKGIPAVSPVFKNSEAVRQQAAEARRLQRAKKKAGQTIEQQFTRCADKLRLLCECIKKVSPDAFTEHALEQMNANELVDVILRGLRREKFRILGPFTGGLLADKNE